MTHHWQFGSLWLNSDIKFPEAPDLEPHIERMQHYGANHSTPWEHFHLLHGSKSGFNLLTKDILDEVQSSLIARDIYYDSSRALQQAVDDADAGVAPQELQDLVRQMHKDCIKTCLQKDIDILNTISEGKKSVEDYLVQRGVPQDKAQRVAQGWYSRVFTHYLPCGDPLTQITLTVRGLAHRPQCAKEDRERDSNRHSGPGRKLHELVVT